MKSVLGLLLAAAVVSAVFGKPPCLEWRRGVCTRRGVPEQQISDDWARGRTDLDEFGHVDNNSGKADAMEEEGRLPKLDDSREVVTPRATLKSEGIDDFVFATRVRIPKDSS